MLDLKDPQVMDPEVESTCYRGRQDRLHRQNGTRLGQAQAWKLKRGFHQQEALTDVGVGMMTFLQMTLERVFPVP